MQGDGTVAFFLFFLVVVAAQAADAALECKAGSFSAVDVALGVGHAEVVDPEAQHVGVPRVGVSHSADKKKAAPEGATEFGWEGCWLFGWAFDQFFHCVLGRVVDGGRFGSRFRAFDGEGFACDDLVDLVTSGYASADFLEFRDGLP